MFSVITREAVEPVGNIHDRMPLMLKHEDVRDWVRPNASPNGIAERALTDVIMEAATG
jgi:putative SOS response-associated peptidase YedK